MPPIKFWLNQTYSLGGDVISRWPPWRPSWISEWNDFSNSEFLCHCDASHQVLAQSDLRFGRRCRLKNFKMAAWSWIPERNDFSNFESLCHCDASHLFSERNDFSNFESLCHCDTSHLFSAQLDLQFRRRYLLKNFKMATVAAILDIRTE